MKKKTKKKIEKKRNRRIQIFFMVFISLFLTELFLNTWCRVQCVKIGYKISTADNENKRLIALQEKLSIELERLKSPNRIIKIANKQIGLKMPEPEQVIIIP